MVADSDVVVDMDVSGEISAIPRNYVAPEASDSAYQEGVRFSQFERPGRRTDEYSVQFYLLRRKAESEMQMSGAFPETSVSAP